MENQLGEILGFQREPTGPLEVAQIIENGILQSSIGRFTNSFELTDKEVSSVLGVSVRSISRYRKEPKKKLTVTVGDRLYRAVHLFEFASTVVGGEDSALEWLRTPKIGLNNRIPLELMATEIGAKEVENLLGRIEYGVIA